MAAVVPYSSAPQPTNTFWANISVRYGTLLLFLLSPEAYIMSATLLFAEAITSRENDEVNGPVGPSKTIAEGQDLLLTR